jgi:hypothetical protein
VRIDVTASALCLCAVALSAQVGDPSHETTTQDVPGLTAEASKCALSTDPTYGLTTDNPIKTGGGAMYLASREVKFLNALRGPAGEGVHFKRAGSMESLKGWKFEPARVNTAPIYKAEQVMVVVK